MAPDIFKKAISNGGSRKKQITPPNDLYPFSYIKTYTTEENQNPFRGYSLQKQNYFYLFYLRVSLFVIVPSYLFIAIFYLLVVTIFVVLLFSEFLFLMV